MEKQKLWNYVLLERCNSEESGLNTKDEDGLTAFMLACKNGHKDVVQLLLDHSERIDLNAKDDYGGITAFMLACSEDTQMLSNCS